VAATIVVVWRAVRKPLLREPHERLRARHFHRVVEVTGIE